MPRTGRRDVGTRVRTPLATLVARARALYNEAGVTGTDGGDGDADLRAFLAEHPDMNHAGKLTGALKKELGDAADGKVLNEVCRRVLGG